jgi:F0F1-type ATP synthase membrane subunit b/b'
MKRMIRPNVLIGAVLIVVLLFTGMVFAQKRPVQNISAARHPNLSAAQRFVAQAHEKIVAAQKANEYDLAGHAKKAEQLLDQANNELKLAAEAANKR